MNFWLLGQGDIMSWFIHKCFKYHTHSGFVLVYLGMCRVVLPQTSGWTLHKHWKLAFSRKKTAIYSSLLCTYSSYSREYPFFTTILLQSIFIYIRHFSLPNAYISVAFWWYLQLVIVRYYVSSCFSSNVSIFRAFSDFPGFSIKKRYLPTFSLFLPHSKKYTSGR